VPPSIKKLKNGRKIISAIDEVKCFLKFSKLASREIYPTNLHKKTAGNDDPKIRAVWVLGL
jgi:hypothetical protein